MSVTPTTKTPKNTKLFAGCKLGQHQEADRGCMGKYQHNDGFVYCSCACHQKEATA
jgi:hypothetical protein